jgi:3-dehydroquinate dehydratase-1
MKLIKKLQQASRLLVVATVHTASGLKQAVNCRERGIDLFEIRLDCLGQGLATFAACAEDFRKPMLITARHPAEGGVNRLTLAQRRRLLRLYLPTATAVDVELRSAASMEDLLQEAGRCGLTKVVSYHNFRSTPSLAELQKIVKRARQAGADIPKVATFLRSPADLAVLLQLQAKMGGQRGPLAVMGMGPMGKVSRLALAVAGSRLNYGFFDRPQVQGQWPATVLAERLNELAS